MLGVFLVFKRGLYGLFFGDFMGLCGAVWFSRVVGFQGFGLRVQKVGIM